MTHRVNRLKHLAVLALVAAAVLGSMSALAEDKLRFAFIDPLSGPAAAVGDAALKHLVFLADRINANGGINGKPIEIVPFDNKLDPQETLMALQESLDRGIDFVIQGSGSHVAGALVDAIQKHNRRNPGEEVIYFNYAAINPQLTNEKCTYPHFAFDANSRMKLNILTDYIIEQTDTKKVFLINQDYAHGQQVSAITQRMLQERAPGIEVVGDVLHPLAKVKDFSPYVAKIKASGADAVVTGSWGNDLSLLIKAGADAGLDVNYYTFYAGGLGAPTAIGEAGENRVFIVTEYHTNVPVEEDVPAVEKMQAEFDERYSDIEWGYERHRTMLNMIRKAAEQANSTEPMAIAEALEGLTYETEWGTARMRADNHQLLQPMYVSVFSKDVKNDVEDTGLGFKTMAKYPAKETATETTCDMSRPD